MSVLETPRIYFRGEVAWDPITTNNYSANYDETTGEPIYPSPTDQVQAFRKQAICEVVSQGNWNPHGTHRVGFFNTCVCGFDLGAGLQTKDPFAAAAVSMNSMLVDLEPYGAYSSQLYFDSMRFGIEGGYGIFAPRTSRVTARYVNFGRNRANRMIAGVASVVWQTSFAKADKLSISPFDSPLLQQLAKAMDPDDILGLTLRFNAYRTVYYDNPNLVNCSPETARAAATHMERLQGGGFQPNPARSLVVGVLGLWRKGEPEHEPGDRMLAATANSPLGSAHVRLQGADFTLDFANSVPEVDKALTKLDLGTLSVVTVDAHGQPIATLGSFDYSAYDRAAYEATAGLITVPLAADALQSAADSDIQVRDSTGTPLLAEQALRAIPTSPNFYLDEGENGTTTFQVYRRGEVYKQRSPVNLYSLDASGSTPNKPKAMKTNAAGVLTLKLNKPKAGITAYVPSLSATDQPTQGINTQVNTYLYVRVRPADADIAALPPTWDNVYTRVLANWNAMAPCMDNWLRLDDPIQIKAYAAMLKRLTDPGYFEAFRFMPVTRDMSAGERTLLYNFLDAPEETPPAPSAVTTEAPPKRSFAELSRSMRRV